MSAVEELKWPPSLPACNQERPERGVGGAVGGASESEEEDEDDDHDGD